MIPFSLSADITDESEPNLAVDLSNPLHLVAHAFIPDPENSGKAPFFFSLDGGRTWALNAALPGGGFTADSTFKFGGSGGELYVAMLRSDTLDLNILRSADFTRQNLDLLIDRGNDDQPWVEATTVPQDTDRVYVGSNDFTLRPTTGRTATVDFSLDARTAPAPANLQTARLEHRDTADITPPWLPPGTPQLRQDGPSVRPAIHSTGVIYATFFGWRVFAEPCNTTDVVVCRDDNWGNDGFADLLDPADGLPGLRVANRVSVPALDQYLGTNRIGSSLAIAVDPTDKTGQTVYLVWADGVSPDTYTLHVRTSQNGGVKWSDDRRTIPTAINPSLAVNDQGEVGFLYQQHSSQGGHDRWQTYLEISGNGFKDFTTLLLADVLDLEGPQPVISLGDYANLLAVGSNFYGVFSAYNDPATGKFPQGVRYLRHVGPENNILLDLNNNKVQPSIDPFFFATYTVPPQVPGSFLRILAGVIADSGGIVLGPDGKPTPVPPWGPEVIESPSKERDAFIGFVLSQVAIDISDAELRRTVQKAASELYRSTNERNLARRNRRSMARTTR